MCLWLNFIPFGHIWIALGRPPRYWPAQKVKLHMSSVCTRTSDLCEFFSFGLMCHLYIVQVQNQLPPAVFLAAIGLVEWQSESLLTEKVMWRTWGQVPRPLDMKGAASCGGMPLLKRASSICGCVMVWKNNCAAPYKEAVCTLITLLMLLWQAAVMGREVNAS